MDRLEAVFFDFDGVLIDSTPTKTAGFRKLFEHCAEDEIARIIAYHQLHGGISRVEKIAYTYEHILKKPLTSSELEHEAARYSSIVLEKVIATPWIKGAEEFLERYFTELPLFVVSGTPHDELHIVLEQRQITHYFKEICGSPRRKPVIVNELLERYDISSDSCVFIGDALTDYHAAKETGLAFIGIQGDVAFPEDVLVLPDCGQLAPMLAKSFILPE